MNGRIDLASGFPEGLAITGEPDREEVRRLFREHGEDALPRVHGAFALAAWDESNQRAVLARDALGARPLYYCVSGTQLWFGSRVPKGAPRGQLDRDALSDYLELGYIPSPGTPWSGVRKLPPGHLLRFGKKGVELKRWFEMPVPGSGRPPSRIVVRARLEEAVRRRLAGEPATMLSGGLDSSALVALMTRLSGKVRTYAAGSEEELELARKIATRFRSDHHELRITHRPAEELPALIAEAGEPFADPALLAMAALLREMRGPVLTGDGADELFAGHLRYLRAARIPELRSAASAAELLRKVAPARHRGTLHRAAVTLRTTGAERARAMIEIFTRDERAALLGVAARTARGASAENLTGLDAALAFDFEVSLPDDVMLGEARPAARAPSPARGGRRSAAARSPHPAPALAFGPGGRVAAGAAAADAARSGAGADGASPDAARPARDRSRPFAVAGAERESAAGVGAALPRAVGPRAVGAAAPPGFAPMLLCCPGSPPASRPAPSGPGAAAPSRPPPEALPAARLRAAPSRPLPDGR